MMGLIVFLHAVLCVFLVIVILMQSGRGGGLTENFAAAESVFGAKTNIVMVRATTVLATLFFINCLVLAVMSSKRDESLMLQHRLSTKAMPASGPGSTAIPTMDVNNIPASPTSQDTSAIPEAPSAKDINSTQTGTSPTVAVPAQGEVKDLPASNSTDTVNNAAEKK